MARECTFLHAADLHLGAPFRGLRALSEEWADRLKRAIPTAYDNLIDAAIRNQVDFVVIAGDVFDTGRASFADYRHFISGLERLKNEGIPVYLCTGNHDPYQTWAQNLIELPDNAYMFSADRASYALFEKEGEPLCVLAGRSYRTHVWSADLSIAERVTRVDAEDALGPRAEVAPFGVGVLHTGLHLDLIKAPADPADLLLRGFDYWALGHIHKRYADDPDFPRMVFPGCIQGRDIKETGPRGVTLVTLREGRPNHIEFIATSSIAWEQIRVDVSECLTVAEVIEKVMRAQFLANGRAQCKQMVTRITLVGASDLHEVFSRPGVLEDMRTGINESYYDFFCDALIDATSRPIDKEALRAEGMFASMVLAAADELRAHPQDAQAYLQEEFIARKLTMPRVSTSMLETLATEAEDLVLGLLVGQEDKR